MRRDDLVRLTHMLQAAKDAMEFAKGKSREDLNNDRMLVLSLVKSIEIIGEAAAKVSAETRRQARQIPWKDIVAMRNRLIHVYYSIDLDRVWDTVRADLPPLIAKLQEIIAREELLIARPKT